jgi:hypothetical protein
MEDFYKVIIYKVRYEMPMRRLIATVVIDASSTGEVTRTNDEAYVEA